MTTYPTGSAMAREWGPTARVVLRDGPHRHGAQVDLVAGSHLEDLVGRQGAHQRAGAGGHAQPRHRPEPPQRRQVQVVHVEVGDQDRVHRTDVRDRHAAAQVGEAGRQGGIGEDPVAVDLDQDRGVADPGDGRGHPPTVPVRPPPVAATPPGLRAWPRRLEGLRPSSSPHQRGGSAGHDTGDAGGRADAGSPGQRLTDPRGAIVVLGGSSEPVVTRHTPLTTCRVTIPAKAALAALIRNQRSSEE